MSKGSNTILKIGTVLNDKWVILEFIGKGGMGEVYRAHQSNLKRDVAIKIISQEWLQSLDDDEEDIEIALQRLRNEVQAMAQIRHSNILQIFDFSSALVKTGDEDASIEYIAMEHIPGGTLRETMSEEGFAPEEDLTKNWMLKYFFPVLDGVRAMHKLDIIHRDLKPENVLMDGNIPKIADFGLARSFRWKPVTQSIDVKGTPPYMSPEQFFDLKSADQRADIYSLGKMLFEAIDGKITSKVKPFKSVNLSNPNTPFFQELDRIIQDATAEDKEKRIASVDKLHNALQEAMETPKGERVSEVFKPSGLASILSRPKWIWTGITVTIISVVLMALWHLMGGPGKSITPAVGPRITDQRVDEPDSIITSKIVSQSSTVPIQSLVADDGVTLHLIPADTIALPDDFGMASGKVLEVVPFYMDETQVTNHQYVNFLNQVLSKISVKKGVVQSSGEIWLLLGEVEKGYESIVFRKGKFNIKNSAHASYPVLRVTAYGAAAYARYYGRRLPTVAEWLYAATKGSGKPKEQATNDEMSSNMMKTNNSHEEMHKQMKTDTPKSGVSVEAPLPVVHFEPNIFGIRGLFKNIGEWGIQPLELSSDGKTSKMEYVVLTLPSPVSRYPWEAFEKVGFRCVRDITIPRK